MLKAAATLMLSLLLFACMESGDQSAEEPRMPAAGLSSSELPPESRRSFQAGNYVGLITPGMPMATVENLYGSGSVESRDLPAGEGTTVPGYVLFPGTTDELYIELGEDKQPERARFGNPRSNWHDAATGLTIGTGFRELREMNGGAFDFTGFGWDYGGTVIDWRGGELEDILVRLTYAPERLIGGGLPDSLLGDIRLSSDSAGVEELGLRVREIVVPIRIREEVK